MKNTFCVRGFLCIVILAGGSMLNAHIYGPKLLATKPADVVIAFDIHDVLVKASPKKILKCIAKMGFTQCCNVVSFLYKTRNDTVRNMEGRLNRLIEKEPAYASLKADFTQLMNAQAINHATLQVVRDLKTQGYTVVIASNIGEETYAALKDKKPEVFRLFDAAYTVTHESQYLDKSNPAFFDTCKVQHEGKQILFIDDQIKNLKKAAQAGITGIHFTSSQKLREVFFKQGLLPAI